MLFISCVGFKDAGKSILMFTISRDVSRSVCSWEICFDAFYLDN